MNHQNATILLDETFDNSYDDGRFSNFIRELFNGFDFSYNALKNIKKEYKQYIDSYHNLGSYTDSNKKIIDILIIKLNKESASRDRARTKQRNFVAKHLAKNNKHAALVAFYGDDPEDWRFSFVKLDYHLERDESGKVKPTCRSQFLDLIIKEDTNPSIAEIEEAFSIDNVTKEFFLKYKELFLKLKKSLDKIIEKYPDVKEEFEEKSISTVDFSKKLLGQIVFIYFLQKKGWLGVGKNKETGKFEEWGTGPKKFFGKLFNKEIVPYENFFNDILEPLFYEALAKEHDEDYYRLFDCKIPFLNGGLFEPINDYDWVNVRIPLENSIFESILGTFDRFNFTIKEDEPLDKEVAVDPEMLGKVFENMLGVTERRSKGAFYTPREIVHYMCQQSLINYIETNTDVPVGDIETFIQHGELAQQITNRSDVDEKYLPASIKENYNKINDLLKDIKIVDPAVGSGAFPMGMMNEIVKARSILSWLSKEEKRNYYDLKRETIENCLYGVDIDSSAVDITKLRFWLSLVVDETDIKKIKPLPNLDHRIMCGNSLLEEFEGVKLFDEQLLEVIPETDDFEVEQVNAEIEKLFIELGEIHTGKRKDNGRKKEIETELKKLDRKKKAILSRPKDETQQSTFDSVLENRKKESQKKLAKLKRLQKDFFNEESRKRKKELAVDIDRIEWELVDETLKEQGNEDAMQKLAQYKKNKSKPFFLWKLNFSEVFQRENPGFDVVIANPPYLEARSPEFTDDIKNKLQMYVEHDFPTEKHLIPKGCDLLIYFYTKSVQLVRTDGFIAYITQNSWLDTDFGKKFQEFIVANTNVKAVVDSDYKHFDTANINTVVTFFAGNKLNLRKDNKVFFLRYHKNFDEISYPISKIYNQRHHERDISTKVFNQSNLTSLGHKWGLLLSSDKEFMDILQILHDKGEKIQNIKEADVKCGQGLNLTKDYLVDKKIIATINEDALIPIMTKTEGALYNLQSTHYFLIDKYKINKLQAEQIEQMNIKIFNNQTTRKIPPSLILPRGIGRHFCCVNHLGSYSTSAVEIYIIPNDKKNTDVVEKRLWTFLNSSISWLIREMSGRKNLGGGMLKAEATDLKQFEMYLNLDYSTCLDLFNILKNRDVVKSTDEIYSKEHKQLDDFVFDFLGLTNVQREYTINKLKLLIENRENRAITR